MITTPLVGRFANQVFQIAATIAYAKQHGHEFHIPVISSNERAWPAHFKNLANPKYSRFAPSINLHEKGHNHNEIPYDPEWVDHNITLHGYYQSEKYFEDYMDEVQAALNIPYKRADGFVGLHVRRGDYLQFPTKHPVVTSSYVESAIDYYYQYGYKSFVVCSDDMKWTREVCNRIDLPGIAFSYSDNKTAYDDFVMLRCCDNHIISNSSFSLAAHILNPYPEKFCIAPKVWFGPANGHLDTTDLYPKNCVKL